VGNDKIAKHLKMSLSIIQQFKGNFLQSSISPRYLALLTWHKLASFEQLWGYAGDWFEPPNRERGGWSGVNFIELTDEFGKKQGFYLKRQQAHMRRSWRHPVVGEPTFVREFEIIQHLNQHNIKTPEIVYFANTQTQAILLTEALDGFVSLNKFNLKADINAKKSVLINQLASTVRSMHQAQVQHRSLYDKHLFIKENNGNFEVALIDFEKSRVTPFISILKFSDLITLNYRTHNATRTQRLRFFKQYFEIERLTLWHKCLCRYIDKKSQKKIRTK
jgi:tRNA A-37 threonylcarbamoyl transferase component Bud32